MPLPPGGETRWCTRLEAGAPSGAALVPSHTTEGKGVNESKGSRASQNVHDGGRKKTGKKKGEKVISLLSLLANLCFTKSRILPFNKMLRAAASATGRQAAMCSIAVSRSSSTKAVPAARALPQQRRRCSRIAAPVGVVVAAAASSSSAPDSSSFESSLNETQANDALIDQLLACKGPKEVIESLLF